MASARATPDHHDGSTPPSFIHTLPPAKMTGISHNLDFLLFINCITSFQSLPEAIVGSRGGTGVPGGSGRLSRLCQMPCHSYCCPGVTSGRKCETHICPNAFPGSAISSNIGFVVPGPHPCRVLQQCQHIHMEVSHFSLPVAPTLYFLVPVKGP